MAFEIIEPQGRYELMPPEDSLAGSVKQGAKNLLAGGVRGAGSIGATILAPYDMAKDAFAGKGFSLESNRQRRSDMDAAFDTMGVETDSLLYKGGKLAGEVAGTSGVGGALAKGVQAAGASRALMGVEPILEGVARGLQTGGFRVGPLAGTGLGTAVRIGTGAVTGGAAAGLVNPEDAPLGALIGGALPGAVATGGRASEALGQLARGRASAPSSQLLNTAREAIDAGYVIPPNMVKPSFKNQFIESVAGKQATQQIASTKNTAVTEGLVRQALGIADDVPLSQGTLENLRKTAGKAYAEVSSLSPQAAADLEALKVARNEASGWFAAYNRSARPDDLVKAKEARALTETLEKALERHAEEAGKSSLIPALRDARKQIAKTYTVGRALNDAAGTVDARVLGRMHEKGAPLSDGLDVAGKFASAFPSVAKSPQQVGSPGAHNLRSIASMFMGGGGFAAGGPLGMAAAAVPWVAPPVARSLMFSPSAQRGLLNVPLVADDSLGLLTQGAVRTFPVLSAQ
jgi:hypothetical protein